MVDLSQPRARARLSFVDGLRLVAAVQMIQGHTLDALLARELRHGAWFRAWTFARGLTSTTFLFTAGVSFALAHAAGEARGEPGVGRAHRLRRGLMLIGLGYLMRAPLGILFGDEPLAALRNFVAVDVLQCIGASLLLLEALSAVVQSRRAAAALAALLGTLCFALAPAADTLQPSGVGLVLADYFTGRAGSLFPLLPAAGHVLWGLAFAEWTLVERPGPAWRMGRDLLGAGVLTLFVSFLLFKFGAAGAARVSPAFAALKLGLVVVFAALLAFALAGRVLPRVLTQLASETLFLYVSHVLVLYAGHVGLSALLGHNQSLDLSLLWTLGLLICTSLGALGYASVLRALRARFHRGTPRPQSSLPLG
jgi:hypothetical protein